MKMLLLAWQGLLAEGEHEKPGPSSVSEIAVTLEVLQPLTPLLALGEDLPNPCKHAGALQESEEKLLCGRIQRQDCCCGREVRKQLC